MINGGKTSSLKSNIDSIWNEDHILSGRWFVHGYCIHIMFRSTKIRRHDGSARLPGQICGLETRDDSIDYCITHQNKIKYRTPKTPPIQHKLPVLLLKPLPYSTAYQTVGKL